MSNKATLSNNTINADNTGIFSYWAGNAQSLIIDHNTVGLNEGGHTAGIGIAVTGAIDMYPGVGCTVEYNEIGLKNGATGIALHTNLSTSVSENTVFFEHEENNKHGIGVSGSNLKVNCNTISGESGDDANGIYGIHPSRSRFFCNATSGMYNGLHFEGMALGAAKLDVAGNFMSGNTNGLLLGGRCRDRNPSTSRKYMDRWRDYSSAPFNG